MPCSVCSGVGHNARSCASDARQACASGRVCGVCGGAGHLPAACTSPGGGGAKGSRKKRLWAGAGPSGAAPRYGMGSPRSPRGTGVVKLTASAPSALLSPSALRGARKAATSIAAVTPVSMAKVESQLSFGTIVPLLGMVVDGAPSSSPPAEATAPGASRPAASASAALALGIYQSPSRAGALAEAAPPAHQAAPAQPPHMLAPHMAAYSADTFSPTPSPRRPFFPSPPGPSPPIEFDQVVPPSPDDEFLVIPPPGTQTWEPVMCLSDLRTAEYLQNTVAHGTPQWKVYGEAVACAKAAQQPQQCQNLCQGSSAGAAVYAAQSSSSLLETGGGFFDSQE